MAEPTAEDRLRGEIDRLQMLNTALKAEMEALVDENTRLRGELERLIGRLEGVRHEQKMPKAEGVFLENLEKRVQYLEDWVAMHSHEEKGGTFDE